jgi:hypothetical protein
MPLRFPLLISISILTLLLLSACGPVSAPQPSPAPPTALPAASATQPSTGQPQLATAITTPQPSPPPAMETAQPATRPIAMPAPDGSVQLNLVGQHGGSITAVAPSPEDGIAYLAFGPSILPVDVSDPSAIRVIGAAFPLNTIASDLALQGDRLYLIDRQEHLLLFHVSDPETMYVLQAFEGAGSSRIFVQGDWGFTTSDDCQAGECTSTLQLFSLPGLLEAPTVYGPQGYGPSLPVVAALEVPGGVYAVASDDQYAYIAHQGGLLVAGLPGLEVISEFRSDWVSGGAFDLPYAYLAGNRFTLLDLSDPTQPHKLPAGQDYHSGAPLAVSAGRLYGFDTFGEFGFCSSSLVALDIANPAAPAQALGEGVNLGLSCVQSVQSAGDRLFVIDWDGLAILDVSDPDQPKIAGGYANIPVMLTAARDGILYSGIDRGPQSLWVHDARDPLAIRSLGPYGPRWVMDLAPSGDTAYASVWQDGLAVLDLSDPLEPSVSTTIDPDQLNGPGLDASLQGDYLYVAREENGVGVMDLSQPLQPALAGEFIPPRVGDAWMRTSQVTAMEGYGVSLEEYYQGDQQTGQLRLLDLGDPANPASAGTFELGRAFTRADLENNAQNVFAMTSGCDPDGICSHRLIVLDPGTVAIASTLDLPGEAFDLFAAGDYLYVAAGYDGLYVWDVSDPGSPTLAAQALPGDPLHHGLAQRVVVDGDWVYVSEDVGGLYVYQRGR